MKKRDYIKTKERRKVIRTIFQMFFMAFMAYLLIQAFFSKTTYIKTEEIGHKDNGFVAISYFGVERAGSNTLISSERLEQHLKALKASGFNTISQQDIKDYYRDGKTLPDKALFLMFEDGRRDTALFAQKILEENNLKANMLTYADKFEKKDGKFLSPQDLRDMDEDSFWELGTNGYRLAYINVFDRYKNYIGELNSREFVQLSKYMDRDYDHYLMDFIRDDNFIPKETLSEMQMRIEEDYKSMSQVYREELGYMPELYILMHSNTGQFGTNDKASAKNAEQIYSNFKMNFNREGYAFNNRKNNIYDMTRVQPQAYWYVNHLLMKVAADSGYDVDFVIGDEDAASNWTLVNGAAEFNRESIIVTTEPSGIGRVKLNKVNSMKELQLNTHLTGNTYGTQGVYLCADDALENYILVQLDNNIFNIYESVNNNRILLFSMDMDEFDEVNFASVDEDENESLSETDRIKAELGISVKDVVRTVEEGADAYVPRIQYNRRDDRELSITIKQASLNIQVDGKPMVQGLLHVADPSGDILLEASSGDIGYSQRNLSDDVYDAVFEKLYITDVTEQSIFLDHRIQGIDKVFYDAKVIWDNTVNWFVDNL